MNHSICSADRATHTKIVVMALVSAIAVTGLGLVLHSHSKAAPAEKLVVLKATAPVTASSSTVIVR